MREYPTPLAPFRTESTSVDSVQRVLFDLVRQAGDGRKHAILAFVLAAIRCPECTAPVRTLGACVYCGATLAIATPNGGIAEEHYSVVVRVGPSNVDRVTRILQDFLRLDPAEARSLLAEPPAKFECGPGAEHAHALKSALAEGGAQAEILAQMVTIPLRTVTLESAGANTLRVIAVLRAEIELTVPEARRLVAETPCVLASGVTDAVARAFASALEAAGATATVR